MNINKLLVLPFLATFSSVVTASETHKHDGNVYVGADYNFFSYKEDNFDSFQVGALEFQLGSQLVKNIAAEVYFGTGVSDGANAETINGSRFNLEFDIKNYFGARMLAVFPITKELEINGHLGVTSLEAEAKATLAGTSLSVTNTERESSVSYSLGARLFLNPQFAIKGGYKVLYDKEEATLSGFNIGLDYLF